MSSVLTDGSAEVATLVKVQYALRRSRARRRVLEYLVRSGPAYASLISRASGVDLPGTLGALRGLWPRYTPEISLVSLGLVEEVVEPEGDAGSTGHLRIYAATPAGRTMYARLVNDDRLG